MKEYYSIMPNNPRPKNFNELEEWQKMMSIKHKGSLKKIAECLKTIANISTSIGPNGFRYFTGNESIEALEENAAKLVVVGASFKNEFTQTTNRTGGANAQEAYENLRKYSNVKLPPLSELGVE